MLVDLVIAVVLALGVALLVVALLPARFAPAYEHGRRIRRSVNPVATFRRALARAGLYDRAPASALAAIALVACIVGAAAVIVLHTLAALLVGIAVPVFVYGYIRRANSRFLDRAQREIVPYLNRIEASTRSGEPTQSAFRAALDDPSCRLLRILLADAAAQMTAGTPFIVALRSTTAKMPLNMWYDFVAAMELHASTGGNIADALTKAVTAINEQVSTQAEAKAVYARAAMQQKVILIAVALMFVFLTTKMRPGSATLLVTTPIGIVVTIFSVTMVGFGIWLGRRTLADIKNWIGF